MKSAKEKIAEENIIIKETAGLSLVRYISQAILAVRGFVIAFFLGPSLYGIWNIFSSVNETTNHLEFGINLAAFREIPKLKGKKTLQINESIQSAAFTWNLIVTTLIFLVLLGLTLFDVIKTYKTEVILLGIVIIFSNLYNLTKVLLNSYKKVKYLSKVELFYAIMNTFVGLSLLLFLEIKGLLIGMLISFIFLILMSYYANKLKLKLELNFKLLKKLLIIGVPMMIISMSLFLMHNIDKFLVFGFLGSTMTGYYGLASFISLLTHYIPNSISNVLFPRLLEKYSRTKSTKSILDFYVRPLKILANAMPIIISLGYIFVGYVITLILPKYVPAIGTIQILILGLFFTVIIKTPTDILLTMNMQKKLMIYFIVTLVLGAILDTVFLYLGFGISGVALATITVFFMLSLSINLQAIKILNIKNKYGSIFKTYLPFIWLIGVTLIITSLTSSLFIQTGIVLISSIPLIIKLKEEVSIKQILGVVK